VAEHQTLKKNEQETTTAMASSPAVPLSVKWGKETVSGDQLVIPAGGDLDAFRVELEKRTGVLADRQKLMLKGFGLLKTAADVEKSLARGKLKTDGSTVLMLMGTAQKAVEKLESDAKRTKEETIFAEDLPEDDARRGGETGEEKSALVFFFCYLCCSFVASLLPPRPLLHLFPPLPSPFRRSPSPS
jgi:hypothetical protein